MTDKVYPVLDSAQLRRIESTHRGFLYQHVYGAGCLLLAGRAGVQHVLIERDEDLELRLENAHAYVQVKTRQDALDGSDVAGALEAFQAIRKSHEADRLPARCEFWIVSNVAPGPALQARLSDSSWPADVRILWPGAPHDPPPYLPNAWPNIAAGIAWCAALAETLPFGGLLPETLAWKLAATVHYAATGNAPYQDHCIRTEELPGLFELISVQLQQFPQIPVPYRELEDEPALVTSDRLRIIVGVSGAGKTAWAAEAARHTETPVAYFDVAQVPAGAVPPSIARELTRSFLADHDAARAVFAPGLAGLDALRLLGKVLDAQSRAVTVVIDNGQSLPAGLVREMVQATPRIRWILLAQPCAAMHELAALLSVEVVQLKPWTRDSVVAELAEQGCPVTAATAERLRRITGSLPLFTRQAAGLAARGYGGDVNRLCEDLENRTHTAQTAQETILQNVFALMDETTRRAGGVLSLCEVALTNDESLEMLTQALSISRAQAASSLRVLRQAGIIGEDVGHVSMHDGFRLVYARVFDEHAELVTSSRVALQDLVRKSLAASWDFQRLGFLLRLLVATGDVETLVDLATSLEERLLEYGMAAEVKASLEAIVKSASADGESRFWAQDTLVYWNAQHGRAEEIAEQVRELAQLHDALPPDKRRLASLLIKQMLVAGRAGDASAARQCFARAAAQCQDDPETLRILKYDLALALFKAKRFSEANDITDELILEYYEFLQLEPEHVFFVNPAQIAARLPDDVAHYDALKRLADTLELHACALRERGLRSGLSRLHALKFYTIVSAFTSAVRVGQDVADELLEYGDPAGALKILDEQVLPLINHFKLLEYLVQVRSQRAVLLAYLGRHSEARGEMNRLRTFVAADEERMVEFERQRAFVEEIAERRLQISQAVASRPMVPPLRHADPEPMSRNRIGRNQLCPCGSGKKFKRCHGRPESSY